MASSLIYHVVSSESCRDGQAVCKESIRIFEHEVAVDLGHIVVLLAIPSLRIVIRVERFALGSELVHDVQSGLHVKSELVLPEVDMETGVTEDTVLVLGVEHFIEDTIRVVVVVLADEIFVRIIEARPVPPA